MAITVSAASTDTNLTQVATVKTELGTTGSSDDAFFAQLISEASDFIDSHTGRTLARQTYVETMGSNGGLKLMTSHTPLVSISSITDDGTSVSSTKYEIDSAEAGFIWKEDGWRSTQLSVHYIESFRLHEGKRDWSVTYAAGYVMPGEGESTASTASRTLPYDLERACIDIVKTSYLRRYEDSRIKHQSVDETFEILTDEALSPSALRLLERYRRIAV